MKIIEAITQIDNFKHNTYSQADKVTWLSRLDAMAKRLVIDTHEGADAVEFGGYGEQTDLHRELLIPEPFDQIYLRWLEAQIDYANGEIDRYNNAIELFNTEWGTWRNHYNQTHMPKGHKMRYF